MMDIIMVGVLLVSFGVLKLFTDWCQSQVDPKKR